MLTTSKPQCVWKDEDGIFTCVRCGRQIPWSKEKGPLYAPCKVRCAHIGSEMPSIKVECNCPETKMKTKNVSVFECSQFGRCLPRYSPVDEELAAWLERKPESDIYHLCPTCDAFSPEQVTTKQAKTIIEQYINVRGAPPCCDSEEFVTWIRSASLVLGIDKAEVATQVEEYYREPR